MKIFKWIVASAVFSLSSSLFAGDTNGIVVSHYEPLQRMSVQPVGPGMDQKLNGIAPATLTFDALGKTFDVRLEPNTGLLSAASRGALSNSIGIYRGQLADKPNSWVRIVVLDGVPRGMIWDGEELLAIDAPGDSALQITSPVIYRLADTFIVPGTMSCGTSDTSGNGAEFFNSLAGEIGTFKAQGPGATTNLDIGAIGDYQFTNAQGGDSAAAAAIVTRLNNVDGIFSQQIGVQITIQTMETFNDSAADPFSNTTVPSALLGELAAYRQATPAQSSQGLTHLYTGRDLDNPTVGIAYSGPTALCHPSSGSGLTEMHTDPVFDSLVTAHEMGHNFDAPHDGDPDFACAAELQTFLMAPTLNQSNQFSPCSISIMKATAAGAFCVVALPGVDMTVALNGQPPTALLSNSATLTFDVTNNGTLQATNVSVDVTLPNNVSYVSSAASVGTCTFNAGTVNCQIGDVPGTSGRSVTVSTITTAVGAGTFTATTTADVDDDDTNNQQSVQLTVDPAVNLVINVPTAATILVGQSTSLSAVLENQSVLNATGVTLSVALGSGLRADSATWSIGACTVTAQQVDCQANSFASQSNSTISIGVTGLTAGSKSYSVSLASNEADTVLANNSANGSVTVNSETANEDDSGGGSSGLAFLSMLGCAVFWTRRRRTLRP